MALCKTTVLKVYNHVIEDVISGVRDIFTDEGLDEQVLQELKLLWESKLLSSKAVDSNPDNPDGKTVKKSDVTNNVSIFNQQIKQQQQFVKPINAQSQQHQNSTNHMQSHAVQAEDKLIPIQITLPSQPTIDSATRVLTIHVPASALNGPQLHTLLTGPVITATMGLPAPLASSLLQQHVNAALQSQLQQQQQSIALQIPMTNNKALMPQVDGPGCSSLYMQRVHRAKNPDLKRRVGRKPITIEIVCRGIRNSNVDGGTDTSDEDEDGSDDEGSDDEVDEDKEDDDPDGMDDTTNEEEPLNSEDDVTDEEPSDLFDTDNVVVCQYDKITRSRNKWKFYLKDGIMNLEGEDFVFQKANGDAEW